MEHSWFPERKMSSVLWAIFCCNVYQKLQKKMAASHSLEQDSLQGYPWRDIPIPQKSNITAISVTVGDALLDLHYNRHYLNCCMNSLTFSLPIKFLRWNLIGSPGSCILINRTSNTDWFEGARGLKTVVCVYEIQINHDTICDFWLEQGSLSFLIE